MTLSDGERLEQTRALETLNVNLAQWEQDRDAAAVKHLDDVLSPDLLFRRADGSVVGKPDFMRALEKPGPFTRRSSREIAVTILGERALVTLDVFATRKDDGRERRYRNVRVFFRHGKGWRLEIWINDETTAAEKPSPP